jgi:ubiquinone/menaquinone biosynthesis C-methylase UbiE/uncharacterized protein YbaR (Trm112 family)
MITPTLLSMLCCPSCQSGALEAVVVSSGDPPEPDTLRCQQCGADFPVHFGFPTLIPRESMTGAEWTEWRQHLEKFQARRKARIDRPGETINRIAKKSRPHPPFAAFTGIEEGTILDVGCGPGTFRTHFDPSRVEYVGLDPITLPEVNDFPFVQGIGEYLPFKDGSFTDVVVLAALDHFRDVRRFLDETSRVLTENGRLHIMQSVHEVRGPISAVKTLTHWIKDSVEERHSAGHGDDIPKHLAEYSTESLMRQMGGVFEVAAVERYSATWYSPTKLFLTFVPKSSEAFVPLARPA